ncbi:hypothetical protein [Kingella oralis]|nr:hypothetical protein [Kingella oralis]
MPVIKGSLKTPFARFQAARSFRPRQPENPAHPTRPQNFALLQK